MSKANHGRTAQSETNGEPKSMQFQRVGIFWLPCRLLEDDWLTSRRTNKFFLLSALCVLGVTIEYFLKIDTSKMSFWRRLPFGLTGIVEPFGLIFIWLGMWRYWVRLDDSNVWIKRGSFLLLLIGFWWGSVVYYFSVYLPQMARLRKVQD